VHSTTGRGHGYLSKPIDTCPDAARGATIMRIGMANIRAMNRLLRLDRISGYGVGVST